MIGSRILHVHVSYLIRLETSAVSSKLSMEIIFKCNSGLVELVELGVAHSARVGTRGLEGFFYLHHASPKTIDKIR